MHLLVIRHAIAEDKVEFARSGKSDDLRPLTAEGRRRMRKGARGLRAVVPRLDVLATSPYVRAMQTAEIVAATYGDMPITSIDQLVPTRKPSALADWLRAHHDAETVAVVGHEPHLGELVSWFLVDGGEPLLELKKGGAVMLELDGRPRAGSAMLAWALTPLQLRMLAP
jgi:phosphohistidine phosphatase